jgi:hypothetical protein
MKSSPSSNFIFNATFQLYLVCQIFFTFHFLPVWQRSQRRACMIFVYPMMIFVSHMYLERLTLCLDTHPISKLKLVSNVQVQAFSLAHPYICCLFTYWNIHSLDLCTPSRNIPHIYCIFCVTLFGTHYYIGGSSLPRLSNSSPRDTQHTSRPGLTHCHTRICCTRHSTYHHTLNYTAETYWITGTPIVS